MTANQIILGSNICTDVIEDLTVNATAQNNVTGAAATLFGAYIDNRPLHPFRGSRPVERRALLRHRIARTRYNIRLYLFPDRYFYVLMLGCHLNPHAAIRGTSRF